MCYSNIVRCCGSKKIKGSLGLGEFNLHLQGQAHAKFRVDEYKIQEFKINWYIESIVVSILKGTYLF